MPCCLSLIWKQLVVNPSVICFVSLAHELKSRILVPLTSEEHYQLLKFWNLVHHDVPRIFSHIQNGQSMPLPILRHTSTHHLSVSSTASVQGRTKRKPLCRREWSLDCRCSWWWSQRKGSLEEFCGSWFSWSMWSMAAMDDQAGIIRNICPFRDIEEGIPSWHSHIEAPKTSTVITCHHYISNLYNLYKAPAEIQCLQPSLKSQDVTGCHRSSVFAKRPWGWKPKKLLFGRISSKAPRSAVFE